MKLKDILRQPYPVNGDFLHHVRNAFLGGLIVFLFLRIFKPFGISQAPVSNVTIFTLGYGIITTLTILILLSVIFRIPGWLEEKTWTVGKNILLYCAIVFFIGLFNFLYTAWYFNFPLHIEGFITFQIFTATVTFFVASSMTMLRFNWAKRFYSVQATEINAEVEKHPVVSHHQLLKFVAENEKDFFEVRSEELLYVEAADNYCKFYYLKNGQLSTFLLRSSLSKVEKTAAFPELFRCHRTYLVNLRHVTRVSGNSQGCKLHLRHVSEIIPVSRRLGEELKERIVNR